MIKIFLNHKDTQKDVAATMAAYFLLRAILNFLSSAQTYQFHSTQKLLTTTAMFTYISNRLFHLNSVTYIQKWPICSTVGHVEVYHTCFAILRFKWAIGLLIFFMAWSRRCVAKLCLSVDKPYCFSEGEWPREFVSTAVVVTKKTFFNDRACSMMISK
jgi:hypothetical protein